ncbi:UDP-glycosyltransferase 85A2 [Morella rubra]|uniref:UDP-glycosyltransferase 85A2 n=1 Tax=Morella rubra TaxID=262757 RepID=A0A6A1W2T1_9ROSI|nr:UDP-glycosyltransferase 85A2 [Morella rubra]
MLKFAKLLHRKGFHITFVNTEFNHRRLLKSGGPNSLDGLPDFRFESIPDGLPPSDINSPQDCASLCDSIMKNFLAPFSDLLVKLNTPTSDSTSTPPVTCIISDGFMAFTITAARELGIPIVMLFTIAACSVMACMQIRPLMDRGLTPLKSYLTNGYLDTVIDWIPGTRDLRLRDLPSFVRCTTANDVEFKMIFDMVERAPKASGIVIQTFDALEREVLNALSPMFPHVYAVGPLQLLLDQQLDPLKSIGYSLWKEETECLHWLNSKGPNSVVSAHALLAIRWDQQTNCKYACNDWGIGMEIDNDVKREEVEKLVRELMEGEKGRRMKKKVMEWKNLAEEATGANGSSSIT